MLFIASIFLEADFILKIRIQTIKNRKVEMERKDVTRIGRRSAGTLQTVPNETPASTTIHPSKLVIGNNVEADAEVLEIVVDIDHHIAAEMPTNPAPIAINDHSRHAANVTTIAIRPNAAPKAKHAPPAAKRTVI